MKSLLGRLSLALSLSLVLLFALQWWVVNVAVSSVTENHVVTRLIHDGESILSAVAFSPEGALMVDPAHIDVIYHKPFSGHYYLLISGAGQQRSRSLWDENFPAYRPGEEPQYLSGPDGQRLLVVVRNYVKHGRGLTIAVAEDMTPLLTQLQHFGRRYALLSLAVLLLVLALQASIARFSLRPLDLVIDDVKRLEMGETAQLREEVPDEVRPLVQEFNRLLVVMRERLDRSRSALGNLAHALKTPLTVLLRMEGSDEMQQHAELRQQLHEQTALMRQMIDRQLKRARLAGASTPGLHFDADKELRSLAQVLRQIYAERGIEIELSIPAGKLFAGDREDMLELCGNLLDNACKWAGRRVLLTVAEAPGLILSIEDDGPGCPAGLLTQLDQRGRRLDESTAGHGLGLAIVRDIVEHYQGKLAFGRSAALGGFRVDVSLPGRA